VTEGPDDDPTAPAGPTVLRSALVAGAVGVVGLLVALAVFLAAGPPYAANVGGDALYALGLLAGLVAVVLLWMTWSEASDRVSADRLRWGVGTAAAALLLTCGCAVVSLSHVVGGNAQLWLMGATALVLAVAVALLPREAPGRSGDRAA
jgi:peptidoglycan/LPS O-acetylase OafA/YrhL